MKKILLIALIAFLGLWSVTAQAVTKSTLPTLTAGAAVSAGDLLLSRQGADTSDKKITATQLQTFVLTGNAATATTATNATNTGITDDTTTNATMYPTWVTANTGNLPQKTTSTKLSFNPSTGALSATSFTGAGTGLTGTAAGLTVGSVTTNANLTGDVTSTGNATTLKTNLKHASIGATFNGGGSAITVNSKQWVYVPYGATIQSWTIACDAAGAIAFDVQMDTYANFSTTMTSIAGSDFPTIVATNQKAQDLTLTGWGTTAIPAGDYILFKVTSVTTVTLCNIVLDTLRT